VPLTLQVLVGLVAGLAAGVAISLSPALHGVVPVIEPIGTLWINAIRMTVIPLVFSSLIVGVVAARNGRDIGRVGWRALVTFLAILFTGAIFTALVAQPLLGMLPVSAATTESLRAAAAATATVQEGAKQLPTFSQWLVSLVPVNPVRAASDGAMLPLIIFALAFGIALLRLPEQRRASVTGFFQSVFDAMLVLVRWVLIVAPLGVFALALPLAARLGVSAAGAVVFYIVVVSLLAALFGIGLLYPAAALVGRVSLGAFARASAPAQAVAFSSRSSLAALPVMMDSAAERLGLPAEVSSFFLPLAASLFRAGAAVGLTFGVMFIARLYGVSLGPAQLATVVVTVVLTSFSIPGIPGGSIIAMVPVMLAAGVPVAGIGILLGADTIPDMFRTTVNVTGDMAAATIVARRAAAAEHAPALAGAIDP
jgi:Na+/H+-dicarboxylate symporter